VKYLPKSPRKKASGEWVCLAFPYADKRAYEDRLNDLAFGQWHTPYNPPYAVGNKLVLPVTVTIFAVEHTEYGEAFLSSSRQGELHEAENSATEAYSQGFRRACAQFRLGRYFYTLPKIWVPYNPATRMIALSEEQRQRLTLRLYRQADLLPSRVVVQGGPTSSLESVPTSAAPVVVQGGTTSSLEPVPASVAPVAVPVAVPVVVPVPAEPDQEAPPSQRSLVDQSHRDGLPHFSNTSQQRDWIVQQLHHNTRRIRIVCEQYHVQSLDHLTERQFVHLAQRIFASQQRAGHPRSDASKQPSFPQSAQHKQPDPIVSPQ
jgi:hypothetical protein